MGTPDFAVATLKAILEHNYTVVGVITAPDRPAGRGRKLKASAVKEFAVAKGLKVLQPTNLKSEEFIEELRSLNANLQVVVAFRMLPKVVWDMPKYGTFNLHASLLPEYRGAAPINWAIINGEQKTGITTFFIDDKIDTGKIIAQEEVAITEEDTAGTLHDTLMNRGASLVIQTLQQIESETVSLQSQPLEESFKTAYKLNKDNTKIDWTKDARTIQNLIRGLSPYPTAWSYLQNNGEEYTFKIYKSSYTEETHSYEIGKLKTEEGKIIIAIDGGFISIEELQLPGKKALKATDLLNGYSFYKDAKVY